MEKDRNPKTDSPFLMSTFGKQGRPERPSETSGFICRYVDPSGSGLQVTLIRRPNNPIIHRSISKGAYVIDRRIASIDDVREMVGLARTHRLLRSDIDANRENTESVRGAQVALELFPDIDQEMENERRELLADHLALYVAKGGVLEHLGIPGSTI